MPSFGRGRTADEAPEAPPADETGHEDQAPAESDAGALVRADPLTGEIIEAGGRLVAFNLDSQASIDALIQAATDASAITGEMRVMPHAKEHLVGRPFIMGGWHVVESQDYENPDGTPATFAAIHVIEPDTHEQYVMVTGETGIMRVIGAAERQGFNIINCKGGLRVSDYERDGQSFKGYWIA